MGLIYVDMYVRMCMTGHKNTNTKIVLPWRLQL